MASLVNSNKCFKKELMPILLKFFGKPEEEGTLPNLFYEASTTVIPKILQGKKTIYQGPIRIQLLKKILANKIQQHIKRIMYRDQMEFIHEMQGEFNI